MINAVNPTTSGIATESRALDQQATKLARASAIAVEQVTRKSLAEARPKSTDVRSVVATSQSEPNYQSNAKIARELAAALGRILDILT